MKTCQCRCGYQCGGPGRCSLGFFACLEQKEGHFVQDCGHKWDGPVWTSEDELTSSVTCSACGVARIHHDMRVGP